MYKGLIAQLYSALKLMDLTFCQIDGGKAILQAVTSMANDQWLLAGDSDPLNFLCLPSLPASQQQVRFKRASWADEGRKHFCTDAREGRPWQQLWRDTIHPSWPACPRNLLMPGKVLLQQENH